MDTTTLAITLSASEDSLKGLLPLLQHGVEVAVDPGLTVSSLLTEHYSIDSLYAKHFISTIFLDGKPVDDPGSATLRDGATLALSGAMPGLVGAVLRSGSVLGSFRHSITHHDDGADGGAGRVTLRVKLFNRVMRETGAAFLFRGITLPRALLADHLAGMDESFWKGIISADADGTPLEPDALREMVLRPEAEKVFLRASAEGVSGYPSPPGKTPP